MNFITIKNDIITGVHCGTPDSFNPASDYFGHEVIEVSDKNTAEAGDTLDFYNDDFIRKPLEQLVKENLVSLPVDWKIEKGAAVKKTDDELVLDGLKEPEIGFKVVDKKIVPLALSEKLAGKIITQDEYDKQVSANNQAELSRRLAELTTAENQAQAMVDKVFSAELKTKITALLAVKKQKGYPLFADFPVKKGLKTSISF